MPAGSSVPAVYRWLAQDARARWSSCPCIPSAATALGDVPLLLDVPLAADPDRPYFLLSSRHDLLAWHLRAFPDETRSRCSTGSASTRSSSTRAWDRPSAPSGWRPWRPSRAWLLRTFDDAVSAAYAPLGLGEERVYRLSAGPAAAAPVRAGGRVSREGWTFEPTGVNKPVRAADGDRRTAWFTARPQQPGDYFEVQLGRPETLAAVALESGYPYEEFPRNLVLLLRGEDGPLSREPWADGPEERWAFLEDLVQRPREAQLVLRFPRARPPPYGS